ncbi:MULTISPECIES: SRPBCC family protein [Nesterenkonia]|uniref:Polyketide cyclase/dehydrase/lipid transport protein n=1 Tax=Nesterenkonia aurantiaca TaxID=1436010 RepID=A0A4R7G5T3_9MICC|nr:MULTISPECIES: SRPBCC family protein [Nesterenkonia]TDS86843.1 polyketide cyclase/dehydrase/lipid transport protein [Nesterenkonia aurantiaca]
MSIPTPAPSGPRDAPRPPQRVDLGKHVVAFSAEVAAPAQEIFALVADPHRHHEIDGSGTVQNQATGPHRLSTGDRFSVRMRVFGIPYRLRLRVSIAQPPTAQRPGVLEWVQPTGHRWRWEMAASEPGMDHTVVTESYDARTQFRPVRAALTASKVYSRNGRGIEASLSRLQRRFTPDG